MDVRKTAPNRSSPFSNELPTVVLLKYLSRLICDSDSIENQASSMITGICYLNKDPKKPSTKNPMRVEKHIAVKRKLKDNAVLRLAFFSTGSK